MFLSQNHAYVRTPIIFSSVRSTSSKNADYSLGRRWLQKKEIWDLRDQAITDLRDQVISDMGLVIRD